MGTRKRSSREQIVTKAEDCKLTKRFVDRTGFVNGYLKVVDFAGKNKHSQAVWRCECSACGRDDAYVVSGDLKRNKTCGCGMHNKNKLSKHPHHQKGKDSPYWTGHGDISGYRWRKIKDSVKRGNGRVLPFEVTIEEVWELFLKQERKCALTGIPLEFGTKAREYGTASLDRIDSDKGYTLGNVQWVHKDINAMKLDLSLTSFLEYCKLITEHTQKH